MDRKRFGRITNTSDVDQVTTRAAATRATATGTATTRAAAAGAAAATGTATAKAAAAKVVADRSGIYPTPTVSENGAGTASGA